MDNNYINFYNNLVDLTRNKTIYKDFTDQDTFSDRLIIFLFHYAFFLNVFKSDSQKNIHQGVFAYILKQLEISLREYSLISFHLPKHDISSTIPPPIVFIGEYVRIKKSS